MDTRWTIKGSTRFGGLIGRGIGHSLSPRIHNISATILGIDAVYLAFDFADVPGLAFFELMHKANCYGFNVTFPYKQKLAQCLTQGSAQVIQSCNTLVPNQTNWHVTSTDADGFCKGLREIDKTLADFSAFIFMGYGGAAKALIAKVQMEQPERPIFVMLRNNNLGNSLSKGTQGVDFDPEVLSTLLKQYPQALLVQCTSGPLQGDDLSRFCPALSGFRGAFVDIVYGTPSALLAEAVRRSIPCQDGIPMLIHQALLSQMYWWGQAAEFSDIKKALVR